MAPVGVEKDAKYALPACGFTAPDDKVFAGWKVGDETVQPDESITVTRDMTVTAQWKDPVPDIVKYDLVLSGQIGARFYVSLPGEATDYANATVSFTVNGVKTTLPFNGGTFDAATGCYIFPCKVNSIQMADTITATFTPGNGKDPVTKQTSIAKYVEYITENSSDAKVVNLAKALADYGHFAQIYLSELRGWTLGEGLDHEIMPSDRVFTQADIEAAKSAVSNYTLTRDFGDSGITKQTFSLNLDSDTGINLYLYPGEDVTSVTYTIDGGESQTASMAGNRYAIRITGISAHKLSKTYNVKVTTNKGEMTINVSALSYVRTVLNFANPPTNELNTVVALYYYYKAAVDAISDNQEGT